MKEVTFELGLTKYEKTSFLQDQLNEISELYEAVRVLSNISVTMDCLTVESVSRHGELCLQSFPRARDAIKAGIMEFPFFHHCYAVFICACMWMWNLRVPACTFVCMCSIGCNNLSIFQVVTGDPMAMPFI